MLAMSDNAAVAVGVSSVVFLILTFLTVLSVRSVPNKLLLLGFLTAITTVFLGAMVPETGKLLLAALDTGGNPDSHRRNLSGHFVVKMVKTDDKKTPNK